MNAAETRASSAIALWTELTVVSRSSTTAAIETFISDVSTTSTNIAAASTSDSRVLPASFRGAVSFTAAAQAPCASALEMSRAARMSVRWLNACGKLPTCRLRRDVVLLGEEAEIVGQADEAFEELPRFPGATVEGQRADEPERAGQELPLVTGRPSSVSAVE